MARRWVALLRRLLHFRPATDGNAGALAAREGICRFSAPGAARGAQQQIVTAKWRISARKARYADARGLPPTRYSSYNSASVNRNS